MAWFAFSMAITIPCWNGDVRCFTKHGIFVLYDPADELQGLIAIVFLGRDQRLRQDHADQVGRRRLLKVGDEVTGGCKPGLAFRFAANIGGLQVRSRSAAPGLSTWSGGMICLPKRKRAFAVSSMRDRVRKRIGAPLTIITSPWRSSRTRLDIQSLPRREREACKTSVVFGYV